MRIVLTSADGTEKEGLVTSMAQLRKQFQYVSWAGAPTDEQLIELGLPARVSIETTKPDVADFGEEARPEDVRQEDGTWQQVWTVEPTTTLAEAKAQLAQAVVEIYWSKVTRDFATVQEITTNNADTIAIQNARIAKYRPMLNNARTQIQAATTVQQVFDLYKGLRDAT